MADVLTNREIAMIIVTAKAIKEDQFHPAWIQQQFQHQMEVIKTLLPQQPGKISAQKLKGY